jgi:hypothetical protein
LVRKQVLKERFHYVSCGFPHCVENSGRLNKYFSDNYTLAFFGCGKMPENIFSTGADGVSVSTTGTIESSGSPPLD